MNAEQKKEMKRLEGELKKIEKALQALERKKNAQRAKQYAIQILINRIKFGKVEAP